MKRRSVRNAQRKAQKAERMKETRRSSSAYAQKHRDQLRGIFNETSPLPEHRYQTVRIAETGEVVKMKVARG